VLQMVNGTVPVVEALCDHPGVAAVTFVGSSRVAEIVAKRCRNINKRVLALGGAKNHLVALPDCDQEMVVNDIMTSAFGSAGQRCMAASALVLVGDTGPLLDSICAAAAVLQPGSAVGEIGPIIDQAGADRINRYIAEAEVAGTEILLDGRHWMGKGLGGCFIGPTILLHASAQDAAMQDEIFGPVLSVIRVGTADEALAVENANEHGNAACIYTQSGASGEYFTSRFRSAMIGVNIGIPVPREPFSFGGLYGTKSKFGDMDITADGAMEFFTSRRKVTTKWSMRGQVSGDRANFDGRL
jgi:malonate-semialdehyde dehydrogenase (acetylating)/methylmalonate-semialdehyde dehydrogenase